MKSAPPEMTPRELRTIALIAFFLYCLAIIYVTNVPFDLNLSSRSLAEEWREKEIVPFKRLDGTRISGTDFLANILFFVPFGFLAYFAIRLRGRGPATGLAFLGSMCFSMLIELLQVLSPSRYTSINDLMSNSAGGAAGALAARFFYARMLQVAAAVWRFAAERPVVLLWGALAAVQSFIVLSPFNFEVALFRLRQHFRAWLASWRALPTAGHQPISEQHLESLLLAALMLVAVQLAFPGEAGHCRWRRIFIFGTALLYPLLTLLSFASHWGGQPAAFLLFGLAGVAAGLCSLWLATRGRAGNQQAVLWRIMLGLYVLLLLNHFFSPWGAGLPANAGGAGFWQLPSNFLASAYWLAKLRTVWYCVPIGFLLTRRHRRWRQWWRIGGLGLLAGAAAVLLQWATGLRPTGALEGAAVLGGIAGGAILAKLSPRAGAVRQR